MKVVCKVNNLNDFLDKKISKRLKKYIFVSDGSTNLVIGRKYTVYGVVFWDNSPWYYLCSEEYDEYPIPFAADFFAILDGRLSSYFRLSAVSENDGEILSSLVFYEWAKDSSFYERLIDGDPEAVELFGKYKQLMDQE